MATNYIATTDGVLLHVGNTVVSLYRDGAAPAGADPDHVKLLLDRGLLVKVDSADAVVDDVDGDGPIPAKSALKDEWVAYAVSKGATQEEAEASTKEDLIAAYGTA
jgi:hypothetical protein